MSENKKACVKYNYSNGTCRTGCNKINLGINKGCPFSYLNDEPRKLMMNESCPEYLEISDTATDLVVKLIDRVEKEPYADNSQEVLDLDIYIAELERDKAGAGK